MSMSHNAEEIIDFWFSPGHVPWCGGKEEANTAIREKYGELVEAAFEGKLDAWKDEPRTSLALILICDQFCRNLYKGTKRFNGLDHVAEELARKFIEQKTHNHLNFTFFQRVFIYLPFEHSENRANQELSVKLFTELAEDAKTPDEEKAGKIFLQAAKDHKFVVDTFGRYPQRNAMLGRVNTPEEAKFLINLPPKYKW